MSSSVTGSTFNKLMLTSISNTLWFSSVLDLLSPTSVTPPFHLDHNLSLWLPQLSGHLCWCSAKFSSPPDLPTLLELNSENPNINLFLSPVWIKLSSDFETAILKTGLPSKYLLSQTNASGRQQFFFFFPTLFCILNKTHSSYPNINLLSCKKLKYNQQYVIFFLT